MYLKKTALTLSIATALLLSACGGDNNDDQHAEGGISGTGVAVGTITAFGSIWVNGVRYDVSDSRFTRNGEAASGQGEYRIGEVVTIEGTVNADGVSGTAKSVDFNAALNGTVSKASTDGNSIEILGQTVITSAQTIFHGFRTLNALKVGNVVEVSGYLLQDKIQATSITLKQQAFSDGQSTLEVKGTVSNVNLNAQTFQLGQLLVDYATARLELPTSAPQAGQYVEVESRQAVVNNRLVASSVELEDERPVFDAGLELELEGLVTEFTSSVQFKVNGQPVITNANTRFEHGIAADIKLNTLLEVEGRVNSNGELIAEEISFQQRSEADSREVEGFITAINQNTKEILVQGVTVLVDNRTTLIDEVNDRDISIQFSDLKVNDFVDIDGSRLNDGRILALKVERELPDND